MLDCGSSMSLIINGDWFPVFFPLGSSDQSEWANYNGDAWVGLHRNYNWSRKKVQLSIGRGAWIWPQKGVFQESAIAHLDEVLF